MVFIINRRYVSVKLRVKSLFFFLLMSACGSGVLLNVSICDLYTSEHQTSATGHEMLNDWQLHRMRSAGDGSWEESCKGVSL